MPALTSKPHRMYLVALIGALCLAVTVAQTQTVLPVDADAAGLSGDCNGNGIDDATEISDDPSLDCDDNAILDVCDIVPVPPDLVFNIAQAIGAGNNLQAIEAADLDGDGDLDLITANFGTDDISVLRNNGDGFFAAPEKWSTRGAPLHSRPFSVAPADLDGDGDLDLAAPNFARAFSLLV